MKIEAVIFDRDHTLVYFDTQRVAALSAQIAQIAPGLPVEAAQQYWATWPGPWPQLAADEAAFWRDFWTGLGSAHDLPGDHVRRLATEIGPLYHTCFKAYPESAAVVQQLSSRGLRLAVLTNFELPSVDLTLRYAGIDPHYFQVMISSITLGVAKPDPRAFRATAAALDVPVEHCAFVDDLPVHVAAAHAVGMQAYRIDRQSAGDQDPTVVRSLDVFVERISPFFMA
ncbi:MAG: HAD-IA family hydrolase [Oscillochloris sp.]|nr:HAD-IA family hydrolase [Oscillochloris sp.]